MGAAGGFVIRTVLVLLVLALALPTAGWAATAASAPAYATYSAPPGWGNDAGEPSVGVDVRTGAVLTQSYSTTYRTTFDAAGNPTWADVTPPQGYGLNLDPILATDRETGVTIAGGLQGPCSNLLSTADDGATWTPLANPCTIAAIDHETVAIGPLHAPLDVAPAPARAAYYCAQAGALLCAASLDGGLTFGAPVAASPGATSPVPTRYCTGPSGHVKVADDGTAYLVSGHCQTQQGIMVTSDNGATWSTLIVPKSTVAIGEFDPSAAPAPGGVVYFAYEGQRLNQLVQVSRDHGATWSDPVDVGASLGLRATTFSAAVAGDADRAAVAFLGTSDAGKANDASFTGAWYLYVATTYDGGKTWTTVQASPDPVQYGWICSGGTQCPGGRNLLDFQDATIDEKGRVVVAYADGCPPGCASVAGSYHSKLTLARQSQGAGLLAAFDGVIG